MTTVTFAPSLHPLRGIPVDRKTITALLSIATSIQSHTTRIDLNTKTARKA